jgi:hypothetical protein
MSQHFGKSMECVCLGHSVGRAGEARSRSRHFAWQQLGISKISILHIYVASCT